MSAAPAESRPVRVRLLWLDLVRAAAAQLIVLHHLSIYGPVSEALRRVAPGLIGWLDEYGRMAVQVFLVMGGLMFARGLGAAVPGPRQWIAAVWRRYLRLFVPFFAALGLTLLAAVPSRVWMPKADWLTQWPDWPIVAAHVLGLYDYLGIEPLTVGAWYVTMDLQLHALALATMVVCGALTANAEKARRMFAAAMALLAALSLLWINREALWNIQPMYFLGSFALGIAAYWAGATRSRSERLAAALIFLLACAALLLEWRLRIALALACALLFAVALRAAGLRDAAGTKAAQPMSGFVSRVASFSGDTAYSLFLTHFAACMLANAWFHRFSDGSSIAALIAFVGAWGLSQVFAALLYRIVERPLLQRGSRHAA